MSSKKKDKEQFLDSALRPAAWSDYIGQTAVKSNLKLILDAARERGQPPEHLLFYGPPGLGKTTLAHLIAHELGTNMKVTAGPAVEKVGDLAAILTNLSPGEILFIDEIHRLNKLVEEVLYPAMESGSLNIILGKGPGARVIQLELPPFTLIAATTRMALLSSPLRSRFSGGVFRLDFYDAHEIEEIVKKSAARLDTVLTPDAAKAIATRSRRTPRLANQLLKRCRDYAQLERTEKIDLATVEKTLTLLGIDDLGLHPADRRLLDIIISKFGGGPVGLNTLAAASGEEEATIEEVHEPYLIQLGLLERTPRGRLATKNAYDHRGQVWPGNNQEKLI